MDETDTTGWSRRSVLRQGSILAAGVGVGGLGSAGVVGGSDGTAAARSDRIQSTIQDQVDDASEGETVTIEGGSYEGTVTIDKPLTLQGEDDPTIDATGADRAVEIRASDVTVEGFEIRGDDATAAGVGIVGEGEELSGVTVADNVVTGMAGAGGDQGRQAWGIFARGDEVFGDLTVRDNRIAEIGGEQGEDPQGVAINLQDVEGEEPGEGGVVEGNEIENVADGNTDEPLETPEEIEQTLPPYGVGLTVQPWDGQVSGAESDGVLVTHNSFVEVSVGVGLGNRSSPMTSELVGNNFLEGVEFGLVNAGERVTAECNYWGSRSGPRTMGNAFGSGTFVLGKIDYEPWSRQEIGREEDPEESCSGGE